MVSISVDKEPADIKVIILLPFFSFEDFVSSRDTAIHKTIETIATMVITFVDIFVSSLSYIFSEPGLKPCYFIYELEISKFHH